MTEAGGQEGVDNREQEDDRRDNVERLGQSTAAQRFEQSHPGVTVARQGPREIRSPRGRGCVGQAAKQ